MVYYVNKKAQDNGDHEVHASTCTYLPPTENLQHLGFFENCHEAVEKAKGYFLQSNGCYWCAKECRTSEAATARG